MTAFGTNCVNSLKLDSYCLWRRQLWDTGTRAPWTSNSISFSSLRSRTKSTTANFIWVAVLYRFENVWNRQPEAFCHAWKALKSFSFSADARPRCPIGSLRRYPWPVVGRRWGTVSPFFTQSTHSASQSRRLGLCPSHRILATPLHTVSTKRQNEATESSFGQYIIYDGRRALSLR